MSPKCQSWSSDASVDHAWRSTRPHCLSLLPSDGPSRLSPIKRRCVVVPVDADSVRRNGQAPYARHRTGIDPCRTTEGVPDQTRPTFWCASPSSSSCDIKSTRTTTRRTAPPSSSERPGRCLKQRSLDRTTNSNPRPLVYRHRTRPTFWCPSPLLKRVSSTSDQEYGAAMSLRGAR